MLVERTGHAIAHGEARVQAGDSHLDWLLYDDSEIDGPKVEQCKIFLSNQVRSFEAMHERGRPKIQQYLKQHDLKGEWASLPAFLDEFWMQPKRLY